MFVFDWLTLMRSAMFQMFTFIQEYLVASGLGIVPVIVLPLLLIYEHRLHWKKPREQNRILVILLTPPVFTIASYAGLLANEDSKTFFLVVDSIRECYAGLSMAMFLSLMHTYMDINSTHLTTRDIHVKIGGRVIRNVFPVTLFQPRDVLLNQNNLKFHEYRAWQFVVIRLVLSVFMIVLQLLDIHSVWLSWAFFFIINVSVSLAFYTVCAFYRAFGKDLVRHMAFDKLCYVKGIIFICFWQGGVLKVLVAVGIVESNHYWQQELQNNLVILEMMLYTIFQGIAYNPGPYHDHRPLLPINFSNSAMPKPPPPLMKTYFMSSNWG